MIGLLAGLFVFILVFDAALVAGLAFAGRERCSICGGRSHERHYEVER